MFRDHESYRTLTESETGKRTMYCGGVSKSKIKLTKKYSCDLCSKKWMTEIDLELHRRIQHGDMLINEAIDMKNFICWICFRPESSDDSLLMHIKTMHFYSPPDARKIERNIYFCDICHYMFFNKTLLKWHIFYSHSASVGKVDLECIKCLKHFSGNKLWQHSILHNLSSFTTCQLCYENFRDKNELWQHMMNQKHVNVLRCDICQYDSKYRESYNKHLEEHSKRSNNNIRDCDRYFITSIEPRYYVEQWLKGTPIPRGVYVCVLCREICTNTMSKLEHISIDHGDIIKVKKIHRCACGEEFFTGLVLKHHVWKMKGSHRVLSDEEIKDMDSKVDLDDLCVEYQENVDGAECENTEILVPYVEETAESDDVEFITTDIATDDSRTTYVIELLPNS